MKNQLQMLNYLKNVIESSLAEDITNDSQTSPIKNTKITKLEMAGDNSPLLYLELEIETKKNEITTLSFEIECKEKANNNLVFSQVLTSGKKKVMDFKVAKESDPHHVTLVVMRISQMIKSLFGKFS